MSRPPLEVIYYPGKPAKGRTKAKPSRWVITEQGSYVSLLEIKQGCFGERDDAELYAILDIMTADFNGLRLRDDIVAATTGQIRDSLARLKR